VGEGAQLTIAGDEAEAAQGAPHGGILDLHLPLVDVEDVEELPQPAIVPIVLERSSELSTILNTKTIDPI
jgi:hypothetical protein